jgi:predicted esterase
MSDDLLPGDERIAVPIRATGYFRMHVPDTLPAGPAALLVATHGYRQPPQGMLEYAVRVAPDDAIVVAPEGPSAFYGPRVRERAIGRRIDYGWIADPRRPDSEERNRDLIGQAFAHVEERHAIDPVRTWLLGFSQGVGVAMDFFVHNPERAAGLVGLAGGVPQHGRPALAALAGKPVLWITGARDADYTRAYEAELIDQMHAAGIALEALEFDAPHNLLEPVADAVAAWLARSPTPM